MPSLPATFAESVFDQSARAQLEVFLDEHRAALNAASTDGPRSRRAVRWLLPEPRCSAW